MFEIALALVCALTLAVMMPRYRNIRTPSGMRRALVLKSGKLRFVKGKPRKRRAKKKRSTRRRLSQPDAA